MVGHPTGSSGWLGSAWLPVSDKQWLIQRGHSMEKEAQKCEQKSTGQGVLWPGSHFWLYHNLLTSDQTCGLSSLRGGVMQSLFTFPFKRKVHQALPKKIKRKKKKKDLPSLRGDAVWFLTREVSGGNLLRTKSISACSIQLWGPRSPLTLFSVSSKHVAGNMAALN